MLVPLMGFFIVEGLGSAPWQIGVYTGLTMPMTLLCNRWVGEKLDQGLSVRLLLIVSIGAYLALAVLLTQTHSLIMLILLVSPLMSISNTGSGTIFTFARFYAEKAEFDVARMNSWVRMMVSLGWMIGPALSFSLVSQFGFQTAFLASFLAGTCYLLLGQIAVPKEFKAPPRSANPDDGNHFDQGLLLAGLVCLGFVITNALFVSVMPLFFIKHTGLPAYTPGLSLAIKCLVEMVVIFNSVRLAQLIGLRTVLGMSAILGTLGMLLFSTVTSVWHVALISVLEGIYYGLFAGVAITFVQSFAPDRPGRATAVYMNSLFLGSMIGSISMGVIASAADYKTVLYVASISSLLALIILMGTRRFTPKPA